MPCCDTNAPETHPVGDTVVLKATIRRNSDSALADPTNVLVAVTDPNGTVTTYTYLLSQIVKVSTGIYTYDLLVPTAGFWSYKFTTTGAVVTASEVVQFEVVA